MARLFTLEDLSAEFGIDMDETENILADAEVTPQFDFTSATWYGMDAFRTIEAHFNLSDDTIRGIPPGDEE